MVFLAASRWNAGIRGGGHVGQLARGPRDAQQVTRLEQARFGPLGGMLGALPAFPGKLRLIDCAAALSCWTGVSEGEISPWPGTHFSVNLRDRIQRQMWCGCYEPQVTRCLDSILRSGDTFLDIGAHIGYHSFIAAQLVERGGRVFAFEPDPSLYAQLARNLEQFPHAHALRCAVWEGDAEMVFGRSSSAHESGWGTLTAVRDLGKGEHIPVQALSLDGWSQHVPLGALRAIKMDAEGSEPAILRGAQKILEQFRPILLLEVNDILLRQAGTSAPQLGEEILRSGYRIYELTPVSLAQRGSLAEGTFADCICLPEEQAARLLAVLCSRGFQA